MPQKGLLCATCYGGLVGILVGLLILFAAVMSLLTAPRTAPREGDAKSQEEFSVREDTAAKLKDREQTLARISLVQARAGDVDKALETINHIENQDKDLVRNELVADYLLYKVPRGEKPDPAVLNKARKIVDAIENPVLKGEGLRRIAEVQAKPDPEKAGQNLQDATQLVLGAPKTADRPGLFSWWLLLWPAGLAIFGALLVWAGRGLWRSLKDSGDAAVPAVTEGLPEGS